MNPRAATAAVIIAAAVLITAIAATITHDKPGPALTTGHLVDVSSGISTSDREHFYLAAAALLIGLNVARFLVTRNAASRVD